MLVGRCYRSNSLAGQGHVAILLPDGKVLQSFQFGADGEPGLNTDYTIEESHAGGYYEVMVHPEGWINHDRGQIRVTKPASKKAAPGEVEGQVAGARRVHKKRRDGKGEPDGSEAIERYDGDDVENIDLEELGREVLRLIRRYARQIEAPRRRSEVHNEEEED